jgi:electron transfer flavoprotein alpha/beta subunit
MKLIVLLKSPRREPRSHEILGGLAPGDRAALNTALDLVSHADDASLLALSAGPAEDNAALVEALKAGAHRAIRVIDPSLNIGDLRTKASVLSAAIQQLDFDLVLTGNRSSDWGSGSTGPATAHLLGIPHLTSVLSASWYGDGNGIDERLKLVHAREGQLYSLLLKLPALVTISAGPSPPPARVDDLPEVEPLSLADMTLPFRFYARSTPDLERSTEPASSIEDVTGLVRILRDLTG